VLILRVIILSVAPSMPKWISDVREVLEYRMANRYLTAEHLEAERRQQEEYNAKMNDSITVMKRQLRNKDRDELLDLFEEQDQVRPRRTTPTRCCCCCTLARCTLALCMTLHDMAWDGMGWHALRMARARIRARSRALRYAAAHLCCVAHGCPCLCSRRAVHHRHCLQDHSGAIDDRELKGFFAALGVQLSDKEVSNAMKDIDESGDNNVGFEEMIDWLQAKGVWDEQKIGLPCAPSLPLNRLHSTPSSLARSLTHSLTHSLCGA
jgi:hypothetical protein